MQNNRDALMRNLVRLTRERHARYANTFYHLEPNVKETPGGLRDYQSVRWMEQLRDADTARVPTPEAPDDCGRPSVSWRGSAGTSMRKPDATRTCSLSKRRTPWPSSGEGGDVAPWMREYYRQARTVNRAALRSLDAWDAHSSTLFTQFVGWRSRLSNADFSGASRARFICARRTRSTATRNWCCGCSSSWRVTAFGCRSKP